MSESSSSSEWEDESSSSSGWSSEERWTYRQQYQYGGFRYSMRGPPKYGPNDIIPQLPSLYPYPITDTDQPETRIERNIEEDMPDAQRLDRYNMLKNF